MRKIYILLFLIPLLLVSCVEKQLDVKVAGCYFQYEYVNHAWGFNHGGFTISPSGEVFSFDKTTPWVFAVNGKILSAELKKNLEASVKVDTLIKSTDIDYYQHLASYAMSGKLSDHVMHGADMGERICKIIIPDSIDPQGSYLEVILTEDGDFEFHNLSPEAAVIAEWLTKIHLK